MVFGKEIRTNPTLEKKMTKFVSLLKRDLLEKADTLLLNSLRLQKFDHIDKYIPWPWKGNKNRIDLSKKDRISLYKILKPMLLETDAKLLMDLILFQIRCNEALQLFRKSKFEESREIFHILSYTPHFYDEKLLLRFRKDFRKNTGDMSIQLFDVGTMYYYMGMISFGMGNYEQAIIDADDSLLSYDNADYRDECASYFLLSNSYYRLQKFQDAIESQLEVNEIALRNKDQRLTRISYYNLGNFYTHIFDFDKALEYAINNHNICTEKDNSENILYSLLLLAKVHQQMNSFHNALEYFQNAYDLLMDKIAYNALIHSYILYNLILIYNKTHDFPTSIRYLGEMEKIDDQESPAYCRMLFLLSKVNIAIYTHSIPENDDIDEIIELLNKDTLELNERNSALLILSIIDLEYADTNIYTQLMELNSISRYMEKSIFPPFICYQIYKEIENKNNERKIDQWVKSLRLFLIITDNKLDNSLIDRFINSLHLPSSDILSNLVMDISKNYLHSNYVEIENYFLVND